MPVKRSPLLMALLASACFGICLRSEETDLGRWAGTWSGHLEIFPKGTGSTKKVPMTLEIQPKDEGAWRWKMVFDPQGKPVIKDYRLAKGPNGRWIMDENNGIKLEGVRRGDTLLFLFRVDDTLLDTRYRFNADGSLTMETITSSAGKAQNQGGDKSPRAESIPVLSFQSATLKRDPSPATR